MIKGFESNKTYSPQMGMLRERWDQLRKMAAQELARNFTLPASMSSERPKSVAPAA